MSIMKMMQDRFKILSSIFKWGWDGIYLLNNFTVSMQCPYYRFTTSLVSHVKAIVSNFTCICIV